MRSELSSAAFRGELCFRRRVVVFGNVHWVRCFLDCFNKARRRTPAPRSLLGLETNAARRRRRARGRFSAASSSSVSNEGKQNKFRRATKHDWAVGHYGRRVTMSEWRRPRTEKKTIFTWFPSPLYRCYCRRGTPWCYGNCLEWDISVKKGKG